MRHLAIAQNLSRTGDSAVLPTRHRLQPFRFSPSFSGPRPCLTGGVSRKSHHWLDRWRITRKPRHREWVLPVGIFLAALTFQLRGEVAVQRQLPWQPAPISATGLTRFENDVSLGYDPESFALTEEDAVREIILAGSDMPSAMALDVADTIAHEARAQGYDPFLALAIMHVESGFHFEAVSPRGAEGLMQVMPKTQQWLLSVDPALTHVAQRTDPTMNVRLGMRYFGHLQRSFGRTDWALQAYNCGPGCLLEHLHDERELPEETAVYAQKVLHNYNHLRSQYGYLTKFTPAPTTRSPHVTHVAQIKKRLLAKRAPAGPRPLSP